jgi:hypothetical protein
VVRKGRVDVYVQYYWKGGGEGLHAWAERGRLRERERERERWEVWFRDSPILGEVIYWVK